MQKVIYGYVATQDVAVTVCETQNALPGWLVIALC